MAKHLVTEVMAELPRIEPKIRRVEVVPDAAQGIMVGIDALRFQWPSRAIRAIRLEKSLINGVHRNRSK
jgi:hypothetical protein